ncbi:DNA primase [uncultured Sphingomonas sp.]|mgnify:CR=1 FL=1|uniref:DNA primase n=1 Tax=uncultured Sphingomonas sp. TaxID=158754 RepID=UPI0025D1F186|nr:DNA primase [uncultured Sphingomonas sp.]
MASAAQASRTDSGQPRRPGGGGGLLSPAFIDELRNRTSLSGLIGKSVKLQKAGREYKGCCPFHNEKTPSFYVNDEKAFYHCFGCGAHGDAIRFLTEAKGLPFMDAVKDLAQAAGLELPAPDPAARARAERASGLVGVSEAAAAWFRKQLDGIEGAAARTYLDKRGIGAHARETFGIGFAPDGRNRLAPALDPVKEAELVEAGLLIKPDDGGRAYDRFRGRLMIPIRDARGRTIAFGGRILDQGEPKYLNSPDTPLFDKGRTLFNLDRAGPLARKSGRAIVVEGYMDVIALDQAGIGEAMAPLGTALTEAQMARLWTLTDAPVLCFDGDAAGRKASLRAAHRALPILRPGKTLRFAMLPAGKDPDDLVRDGGADAFEAAIADPVPLDVLLYQEAREAADMDRPEARAGLRQALNELAASCGDKLVAEEYRRSLTSLFFEDFGWNKAERRTIASAVLRAGATEKPRDLRDAYVEGLLYGLSRQPGLIADHMDQLGGLPIADEKLDRWRRALMDAAWRHPALDSDAIPSILETALLPEVLQFNLQQRLRFPFIGTDGSLAAEQLGALIDMLCAERELGEQLAMLNAEAQGAVANGNEDRYGRVESERADIREQQARLLEHAFGLGQQD